jgi:hypothetical protein
VSTGFGANGAVSVCLSGVFPAIVSIIYQNGVKVKDSCFPEQSELAPVEDHDMLKASLIIYG